MNRAPVALVAFALVGAGLVALGPPAEERARRVADAASWAGGDLQEPAPAAEAVAAAGPGRVVIDLVDDPDEAWLDEVSARLGREATWLHPLSEDEGLAVAEVPDVARAVRALDGLAFVEGVEADSSWSLALPPPPAAVDAPHPAPGPVRWSSPDDPAWPDQWHLRAMDAPIGWALTRHGAGVVVAVLDTGVAPVPDLAGTELLEGVSFVEGEPTPVDGNGHGTHVAGTIAQTTNNAHGAAGVAPAARILPIKVLSRFGVGSHAQIAAGIDHAVDLGADVVHLSLGSRTPSSTVHRAVKKAREAGVLVVAAVGNDGRMGVSYPGAYREVLGVGALGPTGALAPYTNRGLGVDLVAPGGDLRHEGGGVVQETIGADGPALRALQGTSMAAPHVTGVIASLLSTGLASPIAVERAVLAGADGSLWTPERGWGALDQAGALRLLGVGDAMPRNLLGALFAGIVAWLGAARRRRAALGIALGAVWAGGLPALLPWLPAHPASGAVAAGILHWPILVLGPGWGHATIALAALPAVLATLVLGPFRAARPLALGVVAGIGGHLVYGGWAGAFAPAGLGGSWLTAWWALSSGVVLLCGFVLAGVERLDGREAA